MPPHSGQGPQYSAPRRRRFRAWPIGRVRGAALVRRHAPEMAADVAIGQPPCRRHVGFEQDHLRRVAGRRRCEQQPPLARPLHHVRRPDGLAPPDHPGGLSLAAPSRRRLQEQRRFLASVAAFVGADRGRAKAAGTASHSARANRKNRITARPPIRT